MHKGKSGGKSEYPMRINKYLAHQGRATRREADTLIEKGKVFINDRAARLGDKVDEGDLVEVRSRAKQYRYFAYHKPRGIISHSPAEGERDIRETAGIPGVFPVGRLDKDSRGLIILTDDGRITDRLLNPEHEHDKEYAVTVDKPLSQFLKRHMEQGVDIEGYITQPAAVEFLSANTFFITLTEGKKHQIRRMCAALGFAVTDLCRTRVMNVKLGALARGAARPIAGAELAGLLKSLGLQSGKSAARAQSKRNRTLRSSSRRSR
jgi:23S rRNA pseudouridine2604 synthase